MTGETSVNQASLRMREPAELIGRWTVTADINSKKLPCTIVFSDQRIDAANAWCLSSGGNCLNKVLTGVVGWRPAPDGIEFASADGRTVAMFDANGDARGAGGAALKLARATD